MRQMKEKAIRANDYEAADKFEKQIQDLTKNRVDAQISIEQKAS